LAARNNALLGTHLLRIDNNKQNQLVTTQKRII
jgi:hypothetical protein